MGSEASVPGAESVEGASVAAVGWGSGTSEAETKTGAELWPSEGAGASPDEPLSEGVGAESEDEPLSVGEGVSTLDPMSEGAGVESVGAGSGEASVVGSGEESSVGEGAVQLPPSDGALSLEPESEEGAGAMGVEADGGAGTEVEGAPPITLTLVAGTRKGLETVLPPPMSAEVVTEPELPLSWLPDPDPEGVCTPEGGAGAEETTGGASLVGAGTAAVAEGTKVGIAVGVPSGPMWTW